jgi:hypothetical protein
MRWFKIKTLVPMFGYRVYCRAKVYNGIVYENADGYIILKTAKSYHFWHKEFEDGYLIKRHCADYYVKD